MKRKFLLLLLSKTAILFPIQLDELAVKKVHAHLLIDDVHAAVQTAKSYLTSFPESKPLRLSLIRALCQNGDEMEALHHWNEITKKHEELLSDRLALETLAWGVLKKGNSSQQLLVKLFSLMGAAFTQDAKGIPIILEYLKSSNAIFRSIAVGLAAEYGDLPLRDEIARLLKEERLWNVRLEVIKAVGKLQMKQQKDQLQEIISNPKTLLEEKMTAIVALAGMYETIDKKELQTLTRSNRAGLRELACAIVAKLDLKEEVKFVVPLLKDSVPRVRLSALNVFALLERKISVDQLLEDLCPEVAITAAWVAAIQGDQSGIKYLKKWMGDSDPRWRRLASVAVAMSGKEGAALAKEKLQTEQDPYLMVNLALGLIGQRESVEIACKALEKALQDKTLWMWDTAHNPLFRSLAPSTVSHVQQAPGYPIAVDQQVRLELLSLLCMLSYPHALDVVKGFLQTHTWGTTGIAATTLVREGDEEAIEIVRKLLQDSDENVRIQAALILTLLGNDKEAVRTLEQAYPCVDRELKIRILEALARVGDPSTIPFLVNILQEPFQVLRVIAASALIQCLAH